MSFKFNPFTAKLDKVVELWSRISGVIYPKNEDDVLKTRSGRIHKIIKVETSTYTVLSNDYYISII